MTILTNEADQATRAALHAALAEFGFVLIEGTAEKVGICGYPKGCTNPADRALFIEYADGESEPPLPCCKGHVAEAAAAVFDLYSEDQEDQPQTLPVFRAA
ncbi:hypothetical protein AB0D56_36170 [Streptomyces sp. NPDC048209]|uniref:hypothetical protein n=1 Tax=Streptomyces TaxID=1883 RepID=UPI003448760E